MKRTLFLTLCLFISVGLWAQKAITGTVVDSSNEPIIGASVVEVGTTNGTITNVDGAFSLNVKNNASLSVSFVGYQTKTVSVGKQTNLRIVLTEDSKVMDEVVVVAYGTAKKSSFTGSASVVKAEQLDKIKGSGFAEALQGMSAGVQVVNNEGTPGADSRIQIRGISSMSGKSTPLYIVDGMPYDGKLTSINPSDIESMTVLKDAAASSLYGSRAANGVIVITTKKGKSGKATINFRGAVGTSDLAVPYMQKANPNQQLENNWRALYNDQVYLHGMSSQAASEYASANALASSLNPVKNSKGETWYVTPFVWPGSPSAFFKTDGNGGVSTDHLQMLWDKSDWEWNDVIFSHKVRQDYGIDVSGQTENGKTSYFTSVGYLNDKGYSNDDFYTRYSFRANVESQVTDWMKMGGSLAYSYARQNSRGFNRALGFHTSLSSPYLRNVDNTDWEYSAATGDRMYDFATMNGNYFGICPIGKGNYWNNPNGESFSSNEYSTMSAKYFTEFNLPLNLKFRTSVSIDSNSSTNYGYDSAIHGEDQLAPYGVTVRTNGGSASRSNNRILSSTWNNILTWDKSFGNHNVNVMAGHEFYNYSLNSDYGYGEGIMSAGLFEVASTTMNWDASSNRTRYSLLSFFGKADYNYDNRYYVSASIRRDGSSRFHKNSRWGNFWSVGGSWRVSKEAFMEGTQDWLSNLAIRASYGTSGNDRLFSRSTGNGAAGGEIYYAYQEYYEADNLYGQAGYKPSTVATPDLKWEKNQQFNVAADFSLFNGRLGGTIEYFSRGAKDLLYYLALPISAQVGSATGYNTNLGDVSNTGVEITLNTTPVQTKNFTWNLDANFSTLSNKVTYLPGGAYTYANRGINYRLEEGKSLFEFYNVKNAGVDPETGLLKYWIRDGQNGWKTTTNYSDVTADDYQWGGSAIPKAFGSITNSFKLKDFDMSFMFYGSFGAKIYNYMFVESGTLRQGVGIMQDVVEGKVWEKPGDVAEYPRWSQEKAGDNRKASDFFVFNNDFVRLRNFTFGYTLPKQVLSKIKMSNVRVYVSGDNLLTFGKSASLHTDPETGVLGNNYNGNTDTDNGNQSARRTYTAGVQITF